MNKDTLETIFSFLNIFELVICSQICKDWKFAITWRHRQPFPFVNNVNEFKELYQIPMIGAVIELSGLKMISEMNNIEYNLQRHWTCAPLGKIKLQPGVYISLECIDSLDILKCFPEFKIKRMKNKLNQKQYIISSTIITQKKIDSQDDPIFDTLECASDGTIQRNERNVYGYAFKSAWDSLNIKNHGFLQEKQVHIDWLKTYRTKQYVWTTSHFVSFIIDYFLDRYYLLESTQDIKIKSMTKVSKHSFLELKFKDVLNYNQYVSIYEKNRTKKCILV